MQDNRQAKIRRTQVYDVSDSSFHTVEVRESVRFTRAFRSIDPLSLPMLLVNQADGEGWPLWTTSKGILDKTGGGTTPEKKGPDQKCETLLTLPDLNGEIHAED